MRVIITGGTGLIGGALAKSLADDGHEVIVLSRNPGAYQLPDGVKGAQWDGKTAVSWGHLADGADAIINLAGENLAGNGLLPARWTASCSTPESPQASKSSASHRPRYSCAHHHLVYLQARFRG